MEPPQLPLTGPAWPMILQWPRTASSGRKLTRITLGSSYGSWASSPVCVSWFLGRFFESLTHAIPYRCISQEEHPPLRAFGRRLQNIEQADCGGGDMNVPGGRLEIRSRAACFLIDASIGTRFPSCHACVLLPNSPYVSVSRVNLHA